MSKIPQYKIDYIKEHLDVPNIELAKILEIDRSTVRRYKKQMGVTYKPKDFHQYDNYICENYYKKTAKQLAAEIGCSDSYVSKVWGLNGLKGKGSYLYYFNQNYFSNIDTANKAYLLGLIASDGCLYKREGHQGQVSFQLNEKDIQILEDIKQEMESTHPINKNGNMISLVLVSDKMCQDLEKIGIHPQKTWTIKIEEIINHIPKCFISDFFRGYVDGDGSITSSDNFASISKTSIKIALPLLSAQIFQDVLKDFNITSKIIQDNRQEHYSHDFASLEFTNTTMKYSFLKWIYTNKGLALKRKKELANNFIQKVEINKTNRSENKEAIIYYNSHFGGA